jgi:hypothetical protein
MRCATCGQEHDWDTMEPSFDRPDAYYAIPEEERPVRTLGGKSDCRIRDIADTERRYFLRVLLPIPIRGEPTLCNWGLWVEVSAADFQRAWDRWDDINQAEEPPFPGVLANAVAQYPSTLGLPGLVQLTGPTTPPRFTFAPGLGHPLAAEQREGVHPERRLEWLMRRVHD